MVAAALYGLGSLEAMQIGRDYPPIGSFAAVEGGRLHLLEIGAGNAAHGTIVLLHGASSNLREMALGLGDALARRYRVIIFDRPGHGWSDRPDGAADGSPGRQAALIAEALDKLGIDKAVIVGHSWGGAVAAAMALDQPRHVAGLVLISAATFPDLGNVLAFYNHFGVARLFESELFDRTVATPLGLMLLRVIAAAIFAPNPVPPLFLERSGAALAMRPRQLRADAEDLSALQPFLAQESKRYPEIRLPTLVITGDSDHVLSPERQSRAMAAAVPGARLIVLPGVGHMPQYAEQARVLSEIEDLMAEVNRGQAAVSATPASSVTR